MIITILTIIIGFILLYNIIKLKSTDYKHTIVFILKNEMTSDFLRGTDKPFNLIDNISGLQGDKIYIEKIDKYVFNKLINTEFKISQESMYDDDDEII